MVTRDTILVIGSSGTGKTFVLNQLRETAKTGNIPFVQQLITDARTIVDHMLQDDETGGRNHYHDWCSDRQYHDHKKNQDKFPFTIVGNRIVDAFMYDFFMNLQDAPHDGRLKFAEWSGGKNVNPDTERASQTNISYERIGTMLKHGMFPAEGLLRIARVVHISSPLELRMKLNEQRGVPTEEQLRNDTASWQLSPIAMQIFGHDDAHTVYKLFDSLNIKVDTFHNDGTIKFRTELEGYAQNLLEPLRTFQEGMIYRRKEQQ